MKIKLPQIKIGINEITLLSIFVVALTLRIYWILAVDTVQLFDFANYQMIATNIANGYGHTMHGLPVAWQGSGYPYVLGLFYWLIGTTDVLAGKWLNVLFSMTTLVLCWFIFKKIFDDKKYALLALGGVAFLPQYIAYVNVIGTEVFFTLLLAAIIFVKLYFLDKKYVFVLIGLLIGVAALTRPFMLAYPVIAGVFMLTVSKQLKRSLIFAGLSLAVALVVIAPWTWRNYQHFGRFIPVSYNSGYVLFINNNDLNTNGLWMDPLRIVADDPERLEILQRGLEGRTVHQAHELEPYFGAWAREWIRQNPLQYLRMGVLRLHRTFFDGAIDIPMWTANVSPIYQEGITQLQRDNYLRHHNFLDSARGIMTIIINSAGFLFLLIMLKKYALAVFTKKGRLDLLTAVVYINFAFLVVIPFVYEGQPRYAFPAYILTIPAAVVIIQALAKFLGEKNAEKNS